jgi:peptidoglycan/LPS O-acetylase OafA/YrhL
MEPPYVVNVVIVTIATWFATVSLRPVLIWHFLAAVTYSHLLVFHYVNPISMQWWSLEIEAQFYILMPLLALIFKIRSPGVRRSILTGVSATSFLWQNATGIWIVSDTILAQVQFFLVGLLAADLYQSGVMRRVHGTWTWDAMGIMSVLILFLVPAWMSTLAWISTLAPLLIFFIMAGALKGKSFRGFLSLPWIATIGGMCYSIYLWHVFVMAIVLKLTFRFLIPDNYLLSMTTQSLLIVPVILLFSMAMFLAIEKPCMEPEWPTALRSYLRNPFMLRRQQ